MGTKRCQGQIEGNLKQIISMLHAQIIFNMVNPLLNVRIPRCIWLNVMITKSLTLNEEN
jgi:hypothetical protein